MANKRSQVIDSQDLINHKDIDVLVNGQAMILAEQSISVATPPNGYGVLYAKTDGLLYFKNDAGTETLLS